MFVYIPSLSVEELATVRHQLQPKEEELQVHTHGSSLARQVHTHDSSLARQVHTHDSSLARQVHTHDSSLARQVYTHMVAP